MVYSTIFFIYASTNKSLFSNESTLLEIRVFETPNTTFNSVLVVIVELFFKTIKIDISFGEKLNS